MGISVGDVLKIVAVLAWVDGDIAQNVFAAVITGAGGPFDDQDIVSDAVEWVGDMYANVSGQLSDQSDGSEVRVYKFDDVDDDFDEIGSDSWTYDPTNTLHQMPRGVACLVNAKTSDPDVNGKKYLPAFTEGSADDGLWDTSPLANVALFAADWTTAFTGGTSGASWTPGIWSPTRLNIFPLTGAVIIPTIPAYQRRRKRGVGI